MARNNKSTNKKKKKAVISHIVKPEKMIADISKMVKRNI